MSAKIVSGLKEVLYRGHKAYIVETRFGSSVDSRQTGKIYTLRIPRASSYTIQRDVHEDEIEHVTTTDFSPTVMLVVSK